MSNVFTKVSTYKYYADWWVESTNAVGNQSSTGAVGIQLGNAIDNSGGGLIQCRVELFGLSRGIRHMPVFEDARLNGGVPARIGGRGTIAGADPLTAVRAITSAGNLLSGEGALYRYAKT